MGAGNFMQVRKAVFLVNSANNFNANRSVVDSTHCT